MASLDEVVGAITAPTASVAIVVDGLLSTEYAEAQAELARLERQHRSDSLKVHEEVLAAAERVTELHKSCRDAEVTFTFEAIGAQPWRRLVGQHPPSDEQRRTGLDYDPDSFPVHAIAASLVEPAGDVAQVQVLADKLSSGQWDRLWRACLMLNRQDGQVGESSAASAILERSAQS